MNDINYDVLHNIKERMAQKFTILLTGYLRDAEGYLNVLRDNIPDGDIAQVIEASHTLKSSSGLLGLEKVHSCAEKLEYDATGMLETGDSNLAMLQDCFNELHQNFSNIKGELQSELD